MIFVNTETLFPCFVENVRFSFIFSDTCNSKNNLVSKTPDQPQSSPNIYDNL